MSTRSRIAIENQDGSVTSIYCHFDGYTNGVGKTLEKWYTTQAKVEALIELGDISSLDMTPTSTVAYARDRGEDLVQSKYNRVEALFDMGFNSGVEYIYCYTKSGQWLVSDDGPVMELERAIEEGL
jgi:predicted CxxxxCH...CXXCH cytochrome family protein